MRILILAFLIAVQLPFAVNGQQLTGGLVFLYNFSATVADSSGNELDGVVNGVTLVQDRFGHSDAAFYFDGVDDFIEIPASPLIQISYPVSFSLFVKAESFLQSDGRFLNTEFTPMDYNGFHLGLGASVDGRIAIGFGGGNGQTSASNRRGKVSEASITLNEWHHVAGVIRAPTDMDIYIDCVDAGGVHTGSGPLQVANSGLTGKMGSAPPNPIFSATHFLGTLDQVAMWNRALTIGDINKICDGELEPVLVSVSIEKEGDQRLTVRYNPSFDNIEVSSNLKQNENIKIEVLTINGQLIANKKNLDQPFTLSVSDLPNGIYLVRVQSETKRVVQKISIVR